MFKNTSNYRNKIILLSVIQVLLLIVVLVWSVITGQYPLTLKSLLSGDTMSIMVFKRLRLPRALMGVIGGFVVLGFQYQVIYISLYLKTPWLLPISLAFPLVQVPVLLLQ